MIESHPYVDAVLIRDPGEAGLALLVQPQAAVTCKEQKQGFWTTSGQGCRARTRDVQ